MKRCFTYVVLMSGLLGWTGTPVLAQQNTAAAAAAREEAEARYNNLSERIKALEASQTLYQQKIDNLERAIGEMGAEITKLRNVNSTAMHDNLQRVTDQIKKVDETRIAENKKIYETIDEIYRAIKKIAATPPPAPPKRDAETRAPVTSEMEGFDYVVKNGDSLSKIVNEYRQGGIKVSSKSIMDANPNVKWDKLKVGQKIFIPKPKS